MAGKYTARIVDVPGEGIRLAPTDESTIPDQPTAADQLALAIALALGAADYEHHPEPRNPELQTVEAMLAGDAVLPWWAGAEPGHSAGEAHVVCEISDSGVAKCTVQRLPA
jgi:hypothetical protein